MAKIFDCKDFTEKTRPASCEEHDRDVRKEFKPLPHQIRFVKEFLSSNKKGMIAYHQLGTGKSCSSILAVDEYIVKNGRINVYFISPAAIRSSFIGEYCTACGKFPQAFKETFNFFSYNDSSVIKKLPASFDNSIVIVDECHRIINGKKGGRKILGHIYDLIYNSKNNKVILLSGTPLWSSKYDLALLINLLNPGVVPIEKELFENVSYSDSYLLEKMKGVISYVPGSKDKTAYPTVSEEKVVIPMSKYQFNYYKTARNKELSRITPEVDEKMKHSNPAKYKMAQAIAFITNVMIASRQRGNFAYPASIQDQLDKNAKSIESDLTAKWITESDDIINNLEIYSPKFRKVLNNVILLPGKHMIYSFFKNHYGLYLLYRILEHCKIPCLCFTGDLASDEARNKVLRQFNADSNKNGDEYKVILVSGAGAAGITICSTRYCHILEPEINNLVITQVKGRVNRYLSHVQLPPEERTVKFFDYYSILPEIEKSKEKGLMIKAFPEMESADEMIYKISIKKENEINYYLNLMKRAAFDCMLNKDDNSDCVYSDKGDIAEKEDYELEFDKDGRLITEKTETSVERVPDTDFGFALDDLEEIEYTTRFL